MKDHITVLILTPLALEFAAVLRQLKEPRKTVYGRKDRAAYTVTNFKGLHHNFRIVVQQIGMGNTKAAIATDEAIHEHNPKLAFLVGIAGGLKSDLKVGDVLIVSEAYGYESGKEAPDGFKARPEVALFSHDLLEHAKELQFDETWMQRMQEGTSDAQVVIRPIAAGDKVVADIDSRTAQLINLHLNHAYGVDMESLGFGLAVAKHRNIHALAVRGISDMCSGKNPEDDKDRQPKAAERAAAVVLELLEGMEGTQIWGNGLDTSVSSIGNTIIGSTVIVGGNLTQGNNINTLPE